MKQKNIITGIAIAGLGIAAGLFALSQYTYDLVITQNQIQESVDKAFPIEKSFMFIFDVELTDPKVLLTDGDRRVKAGVDVRLSSKLGNRDFTGNGMISGNVAYNSDTGEFFLVDSKIEELKSQEIPDEYIEKFNDTASDALRDFLEREPVYTLNSEDQRQALLKLVLKDVVVKDKKLILKMGLKL
jgi:hypothetical protein